MTYSRASRLDLTSDPSSTASRGASSEPTVGLRRPGNRTRRFSRPPTSGTELPQGRSSCGAGYWPRAGGPLDTAALYRRGGPPSPPAADPYLLPLRPLAATLPPVACHNPGAGEPTEGDEGTPRGLRGCVRRHGQGSDLLRRGRPPEAPPDAVPRLLRREDSARRARARRWLRQGRAGVRRRR